MASTANERKCRKCGLRKPGNAFGAGAGCVCRRCANRRHDERKAHEAKREAESMARADEHIRSVREYLGL